jgi:phospho-N-acetylmuramoyl-pentapeptide-transferase
LLRVVAVALAAWCHALAPFGGRWGQAAASAKTATAVALFATPLQWFGVAFFLSAIASGGVARAFRAARAFQPIRAEGPAAHKKSARKTKTPTAGGVALVPAGCLAALVFTRAADPATNAVVACTLLFLALGFKEDLGKQRAKRNDAGLRPGAKLAAQCAVAGAFVGVVAALSRAGVSPVSTTVTFGFGVFGALWEQLLTGHVTGLSGIKSLALRMDGFYYALAAFAVVSESNAVNVADGVDGLAASLCATAFVALGVVCLAGGRAELGCFAIAMGGASAGFLVVNRHPASMFMGDSGSLALGGALGAVAAAAGGWAVFPLFVITLVFVAEVLSVIFQVGWFKWTKKRTGEGKRLFRMAPLHHHLELGGWGEVKVVSILVAFGAICAVVGVAVAGG